MLTARPLRPALSWGTVRLTLAAAASAMLLVAWTLPPLYAVLAALGLAAAVLTVCVPTMGFCLLAFSVPWGSGFSVPIASFPVTSTDVIIGLLGGAWMASAVCWRRNPIATRIWTPYVALFIAAITLSTLTAADQRASVREIVKWIELAVVYLSAVWFLRTRRQMHAVVVALVLAGGSQALLGFAQSALYLGPQAFALHRALLRAYGTFDQPNPYAGYLNMILPLAVAMGLRAVPPNRRVLYWGAVVLMLGAILASESRGALLAGMAAAGVLLACASRRLAALLWTVLLGVLGAAWLAAYGLLTLAPIDRLLSAVGLNSVSFGHVTNSNFSTVERAAHWLTGVRIFAARPILGAGIGNWDVLYPAYHPRGWYAPLEHAHNYYINIAAEAGIVGLGAYVLLLGSALWYSYATVRGVRDPLDCAAALGVLGALVATSLHNVFDVLYVHGMVALLGLLVAFIPISLRERTRACQTGQERKAKPVEMGNRGNCA